MFVIGQPGSKSIAVCVAVLANSIIWQMTDTTLNAVPTNVGFLRQLFNISVFSTLTELSTKLYAVD